MTTSTTEFETAEAQASNPDIGDVETFERSQLDAPEGRFRFTLEANYGMLQTKNGKPYLNVMFLLDQEAVYGEDGTLQRVDDLARPHRLFHKFFVGTTYGDAALSSFLGTTVGTPQGEKDPKTKRYIYSKTGELNRAIGKSAWNQVRHKHDPVYGWGIDINRDWRGKPQARIKPKATNGEGTDET